MAPAPSYSRSLTWTFGLVCVFALALTVLAVIFESWLNVALGLLVVVSAVLQLREQLRRRRGSDHQSS